MCLGYTTAMPSMVAKIGRAGFEILTVFDSIHRQNSAGPYPCGFVKAKQRTAGLRLVADDLGWSHSDGPEVMGAGEAILLVCTGRREVLDEHKGEGVETLRRRMAA
jgi:hypothetical protein